MYIHTTNKHIERRSKKSMKNQNPACFKITKIVGYITLGPRIPGEMLRRLVKKLLIIIYRKNIFVDL